MNAYEHIFVGCITCTYIIIIVVPIFLGVGGTGHKDVSGLNQCCINNFLKPTIPKILSNLC